MMPALVWIGVYLALILAPLLVLLLGEMPPGVGLWWDLSMATSWWRKQLRIDYDLWRLSHALFATLGFLAAVGHILGVGYYTEAPAKRVLWLGLTLFWVLLLVHVRLVRPWQELRRPWRVAEVRPERGRSWRLAVEPDGHAGLARFAPGQFAWLTLRASPFALKEHPFSISSTPAQLPRLEFTIKELGDFTGAIGTVEPGEFAWLDGPYGVFSVDHYRDAPGFAFIVGGIGIAPVISMLRSLAERGDTRPLWLFYGNRVWDRVALREEIESLPGRLDLSIVHILQEPPEDWEGETGYVTRDLLARHMPPERARLEYFVCGPVPMIRAAEQGLRDLVVPLSRIHSELFDLA